MGSHYKKEAHTRDIPTCPKCGNQARESKTRYGLRNSCCNLWSWDRYPLVCAETHAARNAAHKAFDSIWRRKLARRGDAYKMLAEELGISRDECHMKMMPAELAQRVPAAVAAIVEKLEAPDA